MMRIALALIILLCCTRGFAQVTVLVQADVEGPGAGVLVANPKRVQPSTDSDHVVRYHVLLLDENQIPISPDSGFFDVSVGNPDCMTLSVQDDPNTTENEFLILLNQLSVEASEGQASFFLHAGPAHCEALVDVRVVLGQQRITTFLLVRVMEFPLRHSVVPPVTGAYFNPDRDGEGVTVLVQSRAGVPHVLLTWYTYRAGRQVWLIGNADSDGDRVSLQMIETTGGEFGSLFDPSIIETQTWGEVDLEFPECGKLTLSFREDGGETDTIDMIRIIGPDEGACP
jgi:hypothetical protein